MCGHAVHAACMRTLLVYSPDQRVSALSATASDIVSVSVSLRVSGLRPRSRSQAVNRQTPAEQPCFLARHVARLKSVAFDRCAYTVAQKKAVAGRKLHARAPRSGCSKQSRHSPVKCNCWQAALTGHWIFAQGTASHLQVFFCKITLWGVDRTQPRLSSACADGPFTELHGLGFGGVATPGTLGAWREVTSSPVHNAPYFN